MVQFAEGGVTQLRRVWVPRTELGRELRGGVRLLPLITGGSLLPVLAVTYQRHVYQCAQSWRGTGDREIGFHPGRPPPLARGQNTLSAGGLGEPLARDERVVVEVKHLGEELPDWLAALNPGREPADRKFAEGMTRNYQILQSGRA